MRNERNETRFFYLRSVIIQIYPFCNSAHPPLSNPREGGDRNSSLPILTRASSLSFDTQATIDGPALRFPYVRLDSIYLHPFLYSSPDCSIKGYTVLLLYRLSIIIEPSHLLDLLQ